MDIPFKECLNLQYIQHLSIYNDVLHILVSCEQSLNTNAQEKSKCGNATHLLSNSHL